jgi:AcrR family transcriptional regulator
VSTVPIWNRPEPGARKPRFTREQLAATAMAIADTEGIDAVSMRRVATVLGAGTMTLYHYVKNKAELLALMDDAMMGELIVPDDELPDDWRGGLAAIARATHGTHARHPWVSEYKGDDQSPGGPNGLRHFEQSLSVAAKTGLPVDHQIDIIVQLDEYTLGFASRERAMPSVGEAMEHMGVFPEEEIDYMYRELDTGAYPHIQALMGDRDSVIDVFRHFVDLMLNPDRFERGLNRLLDGIALDIERHASA